MTDQQPVMYPAPPPPPPPAPKRSTGLIVAVVVGVIFALMACCGIAFAAVLIFGSSSSAEPWKLSADQTRVASEFGPPQTFDIICAADPKNDDPGEDGFPIHRIETWTYHEMGTRFIFRDGKVMGTSAVPAPAAGTAYPKLRPEEFYAGMSLEDVAKVVGAAPTKAADIAPDTFKGLEAYVFDDQVMAEFEGGKLVGVQTAAVITEGAAK
ncbi:MAG: hypothetical protein Q7W16_02345 [Coriobacteriia bacterium]|nr:hypothetical protein [Coriobacteriia bacterium]